MSNQDGGWLFKCCPNEEECDCNYYPSNFGKPTGLCKDHCDRTPECAGALEGNTSKHRGPGFDSEGREVCTGRIHGSCQVPPHVPVNEDHLQAWYNWAGRILDDNEPAEDWQLNSCCARLRVVIDDLRKLREEHNDQSRID